MRGVRVKPTGRAPAHASTSCAHDGQAVSTAVEVQWTDEGHTPTGRRRWLCASATLLCCSLAAAAVASRSGVHDADSGNALDRVRRTVATNNDLRSFDKGGSVVETLGPSDLRLSAVRRCSATLLAALSDDGRRLSTLSPADGVEMDHATVPANYSRVNARPQLSHFACVYTPASRGSQIYLCYNDACLHWAVSEHGEMAEHSGELALFDTSDYYPDRMPCAQVSLGMVPSADTGDGYFSSASCVDDVNFVSAFARGGGREKAGLYTERAITGKVAKGSSIYAPLNVLSFRTGGHAYFVRSGVRSLSLTNGSASARKRLVWTTHVSRFCLADRSRDVRSRVQLELKCGNADGTRATAAHYDTSTYTLYVYFEPAIGDPNHARFVSSTRSVCSFDVHRIDTLINTTWLACQQVNRPNCDRLAPGATRPSTCNVFSETTSDYCAKYYYETSEPDITLDSCAAADLYVRDRAYVHLTDWNALKEQPLVHFAPETSHQLIGNGVRIWPSTSADGQFLLATTDGSIRVLISSVSATERRLRDKFNQLNAPELLDDGRILYVDSDFKLRTVAADCGGLYTSNEALVKATLALHNGAAAGDLATTGCVWCVASNESTTADRCQGAHVTRSLVPVVDRPATASRLDGAHNEVEIHVRGRHLRAYGDTLKVLVCGHECLLIDGTYDETKVYCTVLTEEKLDGACKTVELLGRIDGGALDYPLDVALGERSVAALIDGDMGGQSVLVAVLVAVTVLGIIVLLIIAAMILAARRCVPFGKTKAGGILNEGRPSSGSSGTLPVSLATRQPGQPVQFGRRNTYMAQPNGAISMQAIGYEDLMYLVPERIRIQLDDIKIQREIGSGNFGIVFRGLYVQPSADDNGTSELEVALKTLPAGSLHVREFLQEGLRMEIFSHEHVMRLVGISFDDRNFPMIVTDFMANGDLYNYLLNSNNEPSLRELLRYGCQIAEGMQYLHKLRFIHRDLAARNCMLDSHMRVKVADFGLARDVYENGQYQTAPAHVERKMPLRWMPPESLDGNQFTMQGDVWAYGVTLWELLTRCAVPYGKDTMPVIFVDQLRRGLRLPQPRICPELVYTRVMLPCWDKEPTRRPDFHQLCLDLPSVVTELEQHSVHADEGAQSDRATGAAGDAAATVADRCSSRLDLGVPYDRVLDETPCPMLDSPAKYGYY